MKKNIINYLKDTKFYLFVIVVMVMVEKHKLLIFFLETKLFKNFVKTTGGNNSRNTNECGVVFNSLPIGVFHKSINSYLGSGALLNPFDMNFRN